MTELKDLVGLHMLDAVDFETISVPEWEGADTFEDASTCRFRLGGVVWAAVEDPSDGYRSSMRELRLLNDAPMVNAFPPVQVLAVHRAKRGWDAADVLELIDTKTGQTVLEVGTDNTDDYYPSFVADFRPEALSLNAA